MIKNNQQTVEYYFQEGCYITESWNEPQDNAVSIARARVAANQTTKVHYLKNTDERYVVISGTGKVFLDNNAPQTVKPGDVVYISAGTHQSIKNEGSADLVFLAICNPRFTVECYVEV